MKVLVVHNAYQQRGGEDAVVENEVALLRGKGHSVTTWIESNDVIRGWFKKALVSLSVVFSIPTYCRTRRLLREQRPDVVHVHNFFPLLSPAVFYACARERVPVVFTLHNYRLVCPTALLMHDGRVTERSLQRGPWWAVPRRVYRDSVLGTLSVALMISMHRWLGTWRRKVDRFIVLSEFARERFEAFGIPGYKLEIKPNFSEDVSFDVEQGRHGILFVGRLTSEKGLHLLLDAAEGLFGRNALAMNHVTVVGAGSHWDPRLEGVRFLGGLAREQVQAEMQRAMVLVVPSICYEMFGLVVVEAYASGLPVIASRIAALAELVEDGVTGLLFEPGDASDLASKLEWALANPGAMRRMGAAARQRYQEAYSSERNYTRLVQVYQGAISARREEGA